MLKKSPSSHIAMKTTDSPSAELRFQFSSICGEKTTTMRIRYLVVQARGKREQSPGRLARSDMINSTYLSNMQSKQSHISG